MMNNPEILAPCGSYDSVVAAVRCGANAVYLGAKDFNARKNAANFSYEELAEVVKLCHGHGVRVHITMNTLVFDDEIPEALETLKKLCEVGADVLILQDIGLANLAKKCVPEFERHASTQMSVQTVSGIKLLERMGYSTAVLPRELSKDEISYIKKSVNMRLEAFVHGALCMCVSGQCYLSSMLGQRSGNRGLCAQPCRLAFSAENGTGFDLSLKDLSLIEHADELKNLGISSLKIEGRMKRPEYVAASVTALKNSLEGKVDSEISIALGAVFSRSGFTDGYFKGKTGREMFGIRTKENVLSADKSTFSKLASLYEKEKGTVPVSFNICVKSGEKVSLSASAAQFDVCIESDYVPQKAISKPTTAEMLCEKLSKCGGTMFFADKIEAEIDDGLVVPVSVVNALRREALELLCRKLEYTKPKQFIPIDYEIKSEVIHRREGFVLRFADVDQIPQNFDFKAIKLIVVPLGDEEKLSGSLKKSGVEIAVEIPRGIFGTESRIKKMLENAKKSGIKSAFCSTLDAFAIAKKYEMKIHGGFALNVFNSQTAKWFENEGAETLTLSPELRLAQSREVKTNVRTNVFAYGRLPLMLTRNCPVKNGKKCSECKGLSSLTDRMGINFPVNCKNGCSELLNSKPIFLADKTGDLEYFDLLTLYFTCETADDVSEIVDAYRKNKKPSLDYTRGLYYRGAF